MGNNVRDGLSTKTSALQVITSRCMAMCCAALRRLCCAAGARVTVCGECMRTERTTRDDIQRDAFLCDRRRITPADTSSALPHTTNIGHAYVRQTHTDRQTQLRTHRSVRCGGTVGVALRAHHRQRTDHFNADHLGRRMRHRQTDGTRAQLFMSAHQRDSMCEVTRSIASATQSAHDTNQTKIRSKQRTRTEHSGVGPRGCQSRTRLYDSVAAVLTWKKAVDEMRNLTHTHNIQNK